MACPLTVAGTIVISFFCTTVALLANMIWRCTPAQRAARRQWAADEKAYREGVEREVMRRRSERPPTQLGDVVRALSGLQDSVAGVRVDVSSLADRVTSMEEERKVLREEAALEAARGREEKMEKKAKKLVKQASVTLAAHPDWPGLPTKGPTAD